MGLRGVHLLLKGCSNYNSPLGRWWRLQTKTGVEVYRQADAARRLGVSRTTINRMLLRGELHWVDEDGFRLVTSESLRAAQERMRRLIKLGRR